MHSYGYYPGFWQLIFLILGGGYQTNSKLTLNIQYILSIQNWFKTRMKYGGRRLS